MFKGLVLVTGAAGLLGHAVRCRLEDGGSEVVAVDRHSGKVDGRSIIDCDVTDVHRLHALLHGRPLAGIVHCGAFSGPMLARDNPPAMVNVNIVGLVNVLELARIFADTRVVFCSSTSAVGVTGDGPVVEDVVLRPSTVYGASKAAGEHLVNAYAIQYGVDAVSLRISWVYGPRRTTDCAIRAMLEGAIQGVPVEMEFGRSFYRQYIHVDDAARALVLALERPNLPRRTYTVTGGSWVTLSDIAAKVKEIYPAAEIFLGEGVDPVDDAQSRFDISAAQQDLQYQPEVALEDGLHAYGQWLAARFADTNGKEPS
jgi:nucleoside-diphosphate-sugar epimerase